MSDFLKQAAQHLGHLNSIVQAAAAPTTDPGPCIELTSPADDLVELRERAEAVYVDLQDDKEAWDGLHKVYADTITTLRAQLAAAEASNKERTAEAFLLSDRLVQTNEARIAAESKLASARKALEEVLRQPVDIDDRPVRSAEPTEVLYLKINGAQWTNALSETTGGE